MSAETSSTPAGGTEDRPSPRHPSQFATGALIEWYEDEESEGVVAPVRFTGRVLERPEEHLAVVVETVNGVPVLWRTQWVDPYRAIQVNIGGVSA